MDCVEKYEIVSNGVTKYTQNNAIEESYITHCACPEAIRKGDVYSKTRHTEAFSNRFGLKTGTICDWNARSATVDGYGIQTVHLYLKIDLRRFLPLSNIKYLPAFAGKLELRIMFGLSGLVYTPLNTLDAFRATKNPKFYSAVAVDQITNGFVPLGEPIVMY
jgi:hypothetical protein